MSNRPLLGPLLGVRPLVADGAMGTMIQAADLTSDDFDGLDGCNEWLNVTRPDVITSIHQAYLAAGAQLITTNTFGANLSALGEYGLSDQLEAIALAGARLARSAADDHASADQPRWVLGSIGPGTRLASLDQLSFAELVGATERQVKAMIDGGIDAVLIETAQDLLGVRAAVVGAQQAMQAAGVDMPIIVSVTVELTGALLVGSDLTAVVASLAPLGIAAIGLNCAAGPDLLAGHLHRLRQLTKLPLTCMPNAGLPTLTPTGAQYPLSPTDFAAAMVGFRQRDGLAVLGGCCGTTPEHIEALVARLTDAAWSESVGERSSEAGSEEQMDRGWVSSLYSATDLTQELSYLSVGERANVAGSKAFREALLADELDKCVAIAHAQVDEGAHVLDVCVDYVGRDAVADMTTLIKRLRGEVDIPLQIDSSDPAVIAVGLELAPGRSIINSVHFESGDGPGSKFAAMMHQARRHGAAVVALCIDEAGQARTVDRKLEVAGRLIEQLTGRYGMDQADILIDCLTFPIATGQADTRHDGRSTIDAITTLKSRYPRVHTILGISNVSFGLKPAARLVLNSVFLAECRAAGLDCAIVHPSKIRPLDQLPPDQVALARQLVLDDGPDSALEDYLALFDREITSPVDSSADELPIDQRLRRHIIGGRANGLADTLAAALAEKTAVDIINQDLLAAMRIVGERFGQGQMQLPFVLKSAEVMKQAVALLEPALAGQAVDQRGTIVLATVRGDVHDIGKNLVDIILANNGYRVINLGTKQPIEAIIEAAQAHQADAIGLSGLLVKSTQVMREDLEELNRRGLSSRFPVILGGAALTRDFVEGQLADIYQGDVYYANDAFAGLSLMAAIIGGQGVRRNSTRVEQASSKANPAVPVNSAAQGKRSSGKRSGECGASAALVANASPVMPPTVGDAPVPTPPFWGVRQAKPALSDILDHLDRDQLFRGQWGLTLAKPGSSQAEAAQERLAGWLAKAQQGDWADCAVSWAYWPCQSNGDNLEVFATDPTSADDWRQDEPWVIPLPRQSAGQRLCLADYFRDRRKTERLGPDVLAAQVVTVGPIWSQVGADLLAADRYRDYFELHGLSVALAEALADYWHDQIRRQLDLARINADWLTLKTPTPYGQRYSFGYPALPDLEPRSVLVDWLQADRLGVELTDGWQLTPEQSTDALIVHHPLARYFSVR